jgi:hypothetical protein
MMSQRNEDKVLKQQCWFQQSYSRKDLPVLGAIIFVLLLTSCRRSDEKTIAFINVNLIPMASEVVVENQVILVKGENIVAMGDLDDVHIPRGTQLIDGKGAYLMPGLADMHMHTRQDWDDQGVWPVQPLHLYLANGVTTIRDLGPEGTPLTYTITWRDEIENGKRIGPNIYTSGEILYASPLEDPQGAVQKNHELGFDFLKLYSYLSRQDFHEALSTAKSLNFYTTGHIPYAVGLEGVLSEGMNEIAHVEELLPEFFDLNRDQSLTPQGWLSYFIESAAREIDIASTTPVNDFINDKSDHLDQITDLLRTAGVPVCTTLDIDAVIRLKLFRPETFLGRPENSYFEAGYLQTYLDGKEKHQVQCRGIEEICAFKHSIDLWILNALHEDGVPLLLGTDSGTGGMGIIPGYSIHDELDILIENGFSPYEALVTGALNASEVIGRITGDGNFGTLEIGKRADLILVSENPLENTATIRQPLGVMVSGRWYERKTLDQLISLDELSGVSQ